MFFECLYMLSKKLKQYSDLFIDKEIFVYNVISIRSQGNVFKWVFEGF